MSHGFMGLTMKGYGALAASVGFFWFLSQSFKGPEQPKYQLDPIIADIAKETQPGIVPEHYYKKK